VNDVLKFLSVMIKGGGANWILDFVADRHSTKFEAPEIVRQTEGKRSMIEIYISVEAKIG
jgi:hypothetical protein